MFLVENGPDGGWFRFSLALKHSGSAVVQYCMILVEYGTTVRNLNVAVWNGCSVGECLDCWKKVPNVQRSNISFAQLPNVQHGRFPVLTARRIFPMFTSERT